MFIFFSLADLGHGRLNQDSPPPPILILKTNTCTPLILFSRCTFKFCFSFSIIHSEFMHIHV